MPRTPGPRHTGGAPHANDHPCRFAGDTPYEHGVDQPMMTGKSARMSAAPLTFSTSQVRQEQDMSNDNRRHVTQNNDGSWKVAKPDAQRASGNFDTQKDAIAASDRIVRNAGGGETVIHGRDGKIRDSKTIAPGNDPFPPRDKK